MRRYKVLYFVVGKTYWTDSPPHMTYIKAPLGSTEEELILVAEKQLHAAHNPNDSYVFKALEDMGICEALACDRVVEFELINDNSRLLAIERCDSVFGYEMTKSEVAELIDSLKAMHDNMIE